MNIPIKKQCWWRETPSLYSTFFLDAIRANKIATVKGIICLLYNWMHNCMCVFSMASENSRERSIDSIFIFIFYFKSWHAAIQFCPFYSLHLGLFSINFFSVLSNFSIKWIFYGYLKYLCSFWYSANECEWGKEKKKRKKRNQINNKMAWGHKFCFIKINMLLMNAKRELQTIGQISCMHTQMFRSMIILYDLCAILANKILFFFRSNKRYVCMNGVLCARSFAFRILFDPINFAVKTENMW